jgi:type VI secretion system secreted protein VgrG
MQNLEIGLVIDTEDPTGAFRVRVIIPALLADQSVWARVCQPPRSRGCDGPFRPEAGEQVVVGFIGGDLEMPVVLGSLAPPGG